MHIIDSSSLRRSAFMTVVLATLACAAAQSSAPGSSPLVDEGWELTSSARPDIRPPVNPPAQGKLWDIDIRVVIDSLGHPEMATLRITGLGAAENRDVIMQWIESAAFQPSVLNSARRAGTYHSKIEARVQ